MVECKDMVVMKFGGTSVQTEKQFRNVASLIVKEAGFLDKEGSSVRRKTKMSKSLLVVLSAVKGTTDLLLEAAERSWRGNTYKKTYSQIKNKHKAIWNALSKGASFPEDIESVFNELEELLHGIKLIRECTLRTKDFILSFGERLSCMIMAKYVAQYLQVDVEYLDARECIITDDKFGEASVQFKKSYKRIASRVKENKIYIFTGFIASTVNGITSTLGRNGSDYTASLVGAALNAERIEIWTDVDGILSADPNLVKDAFVLPSVSYLEAMELSYFGAKVIHPQTIIPVFEKNIPILIKNTFNPTAEGTYIIQRDKRKDKKNSLITGIASVRDMALLTVEGAGLSGNFYLLPRIFNVFAYNHVQPLMISQSSSKHSICFVLKENNVVAMSRLLREEFSKELEGKRIQNISILEKVSIISVIGSNMRGSLGLAGTVFRSMGKAKVNVIAIAQGSNEINVSFVVKKEHKKKAIQTLHREFFKS